MVPVEGGVRAGGRLADEVHRRPPRARPEGRLLAWDPPRHLAFSWGPDELHLTLEEVDGGCRFELVNVLSDPDAAARNAAGWHVCLDELDKTVRGEPTDGRTPRPPPSGSRCTTRTSPRAFPTGRPSPARDRGPSGSGRSGHLVEQLELTGPDVRAGLDDDVVVAVDLHEPGLRAGSPRGGDVLARLADRDGVVGAAVHAPDGHVERDLPDRVVPVVGGTGRMAEQCLRRRRRRGRPAYAVRRSSTPAWEITPVTGTRSGCQRSNRPRDAAHAARWPPAEWPSAITVVRSRSSTSASASMPAATSSNVSGAPPPLPTRRYSRFQAVQPRSASDCRERPAQRRVVRRLPEAAVDDDHDAARLAAGAVELGVLLRAVAVGDPPTGLRAGFTGSSSPQAASTPSAPSAPRRRAGSAGAQAHVRPAQREAWPSRPCAARRPRSRTGRRPPARRRRSGRSRRGVRRGARPGR